MLHLALFYSVPTCQIFLVRTLLPRLWVSQPNWVPGPARPFDCVDDSEGEGPLLLITDSWYTIVLYWVLSLRVLRVRVEKVWQYDSPGHTELLPDWTDCCCEGSVRAEDDCWLQLELHCHQHGLGGEMSSELDKFVSVSHHCAGWLADWAGNIKMLRLQCCSGAALLLLTITIRVLGSIRSHSSSLSTPSGRRQERKL